MRFPEAPSEVNACMLYVYTKSKKSATPTTQTSIGFQAQIPAVTQRQIIHKVL